MASITTQNVAAAVATVVQPTPSALARTGQTSLQPGQVAQASQAAAQQQSHLLKRKDDDRSTQVPSRAEGSFSVQRDAPRRQKQGQRKNEDQEQPKKDRLGMDVVA